MRSEVITFRIPKWMAEHIEAHRTANESLHQAARRLVLWLMKERGMMENKKRINEEERAILVTEEERQKIQRLTEMNLGALEFGKRVCALLNVDSLALTVAIGAGFELKVITELPC